MEFRILGPLEILTEDGPLALETAKPRALLANLLLHANEVVPADRLIDDLWEGRPPPSAAKLVQLYVSRLRGLLPAPRGELLATRPGGYVLRLRPEQLDLARFERLVAQGREASSAGEPSAAADRLRDALALWHGPPLAEFRYATFAQAAIARLEELHLAAREARIAANLELGCHAELVAELESLLREHPHRERVAEQLMLALYRSGRQAEALEVYRSTRARLAEELGLETGPSLRRLERAILAHDADLELPAASRPRPVTEAARRLVTVVVAHVSAPLHAPDPEAVHGLLARAWDVFTDLLERHGATVERVLGDAVVGVFGLTETHEDDPARAVRAAVALRDAAERDLPVTVAVDSGEVFVGAGARREPFAAGSVLDAAARLAHDAEDREILLGECAHRLVEAAVRADPVTPTAWRLLQLRTDESPSLRSSSTPLIDRERELRELRAALAEARSRRVCRLITIVGSPGIGKSRLASELVDDVAATVAVGRCRVRGEGAAYGPLADMLAQLGEAEAPLARQPDETFPAVRKLFERLARDRPLIAVVDDAQWADPMLLDLLEYLEAFARGSAIVLLCLARPELLEARPGWAANRLVVEPLSDADAHQLVASAALDPSRAARIVEAAQGNPLFLEQLIAMKGERDELPATIHAVLAARIAALYPDDRVVLEHASVIGESFEVSAVAQLLTQEQGRGVTASLMALMRKQLTRADPHAQRDADVFRFAHGLIREAVYAGMPKQQRAELHERVARRLERTEQDDELIGHHLEQAYLHRADLGLLDERGHALAAEAAQRLASAARTALTRGDAGGAARLLERAVALDNRPQVLLALGTVLLEAGRLADADRVLTEAIERGDLHLEARATVERELARLHADVTRIDRARRAAERALRVLTRLGDRVGQARAWRLLAWIHWTEGRAAAADAAWEHAAEHACDDRRERFEILGWRASAAAFGPMPASEAIARCAAIRDEVRDSPVAVAVTLRPLALLHAMTGDFNRARGLIHEANAILDELGRMQSVVSHHEAQVELMAAEPASAEQRLRAGYERLEKMGERALLATTAAMLAQAVHAQGRGDEADAFSGVAARHAAPEDLVTQAIWRGVHARILAERGRADEAEAIAREGVALVAATDALLEHGDALLALADVLEVRGRVDQARAAAEQALSLYERKGAVVMVERTRARGRQRVGRS